MGRYRRGRYSSRETPLQTLVITVGAVLFVCLFTWIFAEPGMWNMGSLLATASKATPTTVPAQVPSDSGTMLGLIGVAGICAMFLGGGGLLLLAVVALIQSQNKQKRQTTSIAQTGVFSSTAVTGTPIIVEPRQDQVIAPRVEQYPAMPLAVDDDDRLRVDARPIMNKREQAFFYTLMHALKGDYYIFPQVPLKELLPSDMIASTPRDMLSMCRDGIVDYVLADPNTLSAVVGFELDDPSHDQAHAKTRDRKKELLLNQCGIPLLRSRVGETWDSALLRQEVERVTPLNVPRVFLADSERNLFRLLCDALNEHFIFPKIRLRQLIHSGNRLPIETYKTFKSDTVDFVIGHQRYLGALLAIELKGRLAHEQEKRNLLRSADIPLLCFDEQNLPTAAQLRQQILSEIRVNRERK